MWGDKIVFDNLTQNEGVSCRMVEETWFSGENHNHLENVTTKFLRSVEWDWNQGCEGNCEFVS